MTDSTISSRGIIVYLATLLIILSFVMLVVFVVPVEQWELRAALVGFSIVMFMIGTLGFHLRQ